MIKLSFPFSEEKIRALKVGDEVLISGIVHTGRDVVH
jgi:tartrate dehydratase beta subunit/fumarate hydratase class I family protein